MPDNEIVKALEEWIKALKDDYKRLQLLDAPMDCFEESHTDNIRVLSNALDLVNRQQAEIKDITEKFNCQQTVYADLSKIIKDKNAEIERLKELLNGWKTEAYKVADEKDKLYCEAVESVKTAKAEAVKEFSHFLIDKAEGGVISVAELPDLVVGFGEGR